VERLGNMQPGKGRYQVVYTPATTIDPEEIRPVIDWIMN